MSPRLALLTILPLLAVEPALSNETASPALPNQRLMDQLREAQEYALRAGQDFVRSVETLRQAIPRYGMPYLDGQGNIVIPRLPPAPQSGVPVPPPPPDSLKT